MIAVLISIIVILVAFIALTQREEQFRVKDRAYSSCSLPGDCKKKVERIAKADLTISNPFIWPYSGSVAPERAVVDFAPAGPIYYPETNVLYAADEQAGPDHNTYSM